VKIQLIHKYEDIICLENLLLAWQEFIVGKKSKRDVQIFAQGLMDNIITLHEDLASKEYQHGGYESFYITDPKRRHIHKASVRDRLLHHAIYRILYPFFDRTFFVDSFSCRDDKGVHKALDRFRNMAFQVSQNHTKTCWVLKCDIRKFFASIDHGTLFEILSEYIPDSDILWLLSNVIDSFRSGSDCSVGLPLGNLTSQLFSNVYMNQFDQWVKHRLKAKYYVRYADDFVILSQDKDWLESIVPDISKFLNTSLKLNLHEGKNEIRTFASGIDFLGWVHFPDHRVLRNVTKQRMMKRIREHPTNETLQSYRGLLSHGNAVKLERGLMMNWWLWQ